MHGARMDGGAETLLLSGGNNAVSPKYLQLNDGNVQQGFVVTKKKKTKERFNRRMEIYKDHDGKKGKDFVPMITQVYEDERQQTVRLTKKFLETKAKKSKKDKAEKGAKKSADLLPVTTISDESTRTASLYQQQQQLLDNNNNNPLHVTSSPKPASDPNNLPNDNSASSAVTSLAHLLNGCPTDLDSTASFFTAGFPDFSSLDAAVFDELLGPNSGEEPTDDLDHDLQHISETLSGDFKQRVDALDVFSPYSPSCIKHEDLSGNLSGYLSGPRSSSTGTSGPPPGSLQRITPDDVKQRGFLPGHHLPMGGLQDRQFHPQLQEMTFGRSPQEMPSCGVMRSPVQQAMMAGPGGGFGEHGSPPLTMGTPGQHESHAFLQRNMATQQQQMGYAADVGRQASIRPQDFPGNSANFQSNSPRWTNSSVNQLNCLQMPLANSGQQQQFLYQNDNLHGPVGLSPVVGAGPGSFQQQPNNPYNNYMATQRPQQRPTQYPGNPGLPGNCVRAPQYRQMVNGQQSNPSPTRNYSNVVPGSASYVNHIQQQQQQQVAYSQNNHMHGGPMDQQVLQSRQRPGYSQQQPQQPGQINKTGLQQHYVSQNAVNLNSMNAVQQQQQQQNQVFYQMSNSFPQDQQQQVYSSQQHNGDVYGGWGS